MRYDISYAKENKEIVNFKEIWNSSENRILRIDLSKKAVPVFGILYVMCCTLCDISYVTSNVNGLR